VLSDLHNGGERLGGANEVSGGGAPCTCPRLLGERVPMSILFARQKCPQCGRRLDVREMCEVETSYPFPPRRFWDRMCRSCAQTYCDFMRETCPGNDLDPQVFVHSI
jgi:hypothetical protein